jgi:hypothetical protein
MLSNQLTPFLHRPIFGIIPDSFIKRSVIIYSVAKAGPNCSMYGKGTRPIPESISNATTKQDPARLRITIYVPITAWCLGKPYAAKLRPPARRVSERKKGYLPGQANLKEPQSRGGFWSVTYGGTVVCPMSKYVFHSLSRPLSGSKLGAVSYIQRTLCVCEDGRREKKLSQVGQFGARRGPRLSRVLADSATGALLTRSALKAGGLGRKTPYGVTDSA